MAARFAILLKYCYCIVMTESLYSAMKAETYWEGDAAPDVQPLSWGANRYDRLRARRKLGKISRIFGELKTNGAEAIHIEPGQELGFNTSDGLLKVVEDIRLVSKGTMAVGREFVNSELFDERTQAMADDLLFAGGAIKARFQPKDGNAMDFARRVSYFTQAASGLQLVGRSSRGLDRRMSGYAAEFRPHQIPVGSIVSYETCSDIARVCLISAVELRPRQ